MFHGGVSGGGSPSPQLWQPPRGRSASMASVQMCEVWTRGSGYEELLLVIIFSRSEEVRGAWRFVERDPSRSGATFAAEFLATESHLQITCLADGKGARRTSRVPKRCVVSVLREGFSKMCAWLWKRHVRSADVPDWQGVRQSFRSDVEEMYLGVVRGEGREQLGVSGSSRASCVVHRTRACSSRDRIGTAWRDHRAGAPGGWR